MAMDDIIQKVKSVASDVIDEAEKVTKSVVKKSGNLVDQTKLKFAQNDIEGKINEVYAAIGKYVYEQHVGGAEFTDEVGEHCAKIDELNSELTDIKNQIAEAKSSVICKECDAMNSDNSQFCSSCGAKLQ